MITPQVSHAISRLRLARDVLGVTIESMNLTGTRGYWSNFENMRTEPRISTMVKYADALGLPFEVVFQGCPNSAGESAISKEDVRAAGKKLFGKNAQFVPTHNLWHLVCLAGLSDDWKARCQQWVKNEYESTKGIHKAIKSSRERRGIHPLPWWCVVVEQNAYIFPSEAEAKAFVAKGTTARKVVKVANCINWIAKLGEGMRFYTGKGVFTMNEFLLLVAATLNKDALAMDEGVAIE